MLLRMWPRDDAERAAVLKEMSAEELDRVWKIDDLVAARARSFAPPASATARCCPACESIGKKAITHSILMRAKSRTVRYIRAVHDLETKTIHLRSVQRDAKI